MCHNHSMRFLKTRAYAKLNLSLEAGVRRDDGFHPLSSIFTKISLHDTLYFCFHSFGKQRIKVLMDGKEADASNTMRKAVLLYRDRFCPELSVTIRCRKRIPAGGGLGGGSSDAAVVLETLNRVYKKTNSRLLSEAAAEIGSDVPFFLCKSAAYVSGRGEIVRPIAKRSATYGVLILPDCFSSTAEAYRLLDESGGAKSVFRDPENEIADFYKPLRAWQYENVFLPVLEKSSSEIAAAAEALRRAEPPYWNLSGSGSSLYALFEKKSERNRFYRKFNKKNIVKKNFFLV